MSFSFFVTPAKAGVRTASARRTNTDWIPAFAAMTGSAQ